MNAEAAYQERVAHYEREQSRVMALIDQTATLIIRLVTTETPAANRDLLEQWVGAFHLSLKYAGNPQALQFAQDVYRQLHTANHARAF